MNIEVFKTKEAVAQAAAQMVVAQLRTKPDSVLGLPTGGTPEGMYRVLCEMCAAGEVSFAAATTFNLDEYYPLPADHPQSYHTYMQQRLFSGVNLPTDRHHLLDGTAADPQAECARYEEAIATAGGVDLQILGIGRNGHIGFNEPDEQLNSDTHVTTLTAGTREANARFFESLAAVPKQALTMGVGTILKARQILLLATGADKAKVIRALREERVTTEIPATLLLLHRNVTVFCDSEAAG